MAGSLEADELFLDCSAVAAPKLNMRKSQATQFIAEAEMAERNIWMTVDMHPLATFAPALAFRHIQFSLKAVNRSAGHGFPNDGFSVMETIQTAWNVEEFC